MRPTPNRLVDGMRELLRDSIGPELSSERARTHLRRVMAVLRELDWDEAVPALHRENAALSLLLADAAQWTARHGMPSAPGTPVSFAADAMAPATPEDGFATVEARHCALREALSRCIADLEALSAADPGIDFTAYRTQLAAGFARLPADMPSRRPAPGQPRPPARS